MGLPFSDQTLDRLASLYNGINAKAGQRQAIIAVVSDYLLETGTRSAIRKALLQLKSDVLGDKALTTRGMPIVAEVCCDHAVSIGTVLSRMGGKRLSPIRFECYWRLRRVGMSLPQIGRVMNRDHSSVLSGLRKFEQQITTNELLRRRLGIKEAA